MNSVTSAHIQKELARSSASHCATCSRHALTEMCRVRTGRLVNQLVKPSAGAVKPVGGANACEGPSQLTAQPTAAAVPQGMELVGAFQLLTGTHAEYVLVKRDAATAVNVAQLPTD